MLKSNGYIVRLIEQKHRYFPLVFTSIKKTVFYCIVNPERISSNQHLFIILLKVNAYTNIRNSSYISDNIIICTESVIKMVWKLTWFWITKTANRTQKSFDFLVYFKNRKILRNFSMGPFFAFSLISKPHLPLLFFFLFFVWNIS